MLCWYCFSHQRCQRLIYCSGRIHVARTWLSFTATLFKPAGLPEAGEYHWRDGGDAHINEPISIANIQDAVRNKNDQVI